MRHFWLEEVRLVSFTAFAHENIKVQKNTIRVNSFRYHFLTYKFCPLKGDGFRLKNSGSIQAFEKTGYGVARMEINEIG